jgi:hypothetical protein
VHFGSVDTRFSREIEWLDVRSVRVAQSEAFGLPCCNERCKEHFRLRKLKRRLSDLRARSLQQPRSMVYQQRCVLK